jgi:hypothetical protein
MSLSDKPKSFLQQKEKNNMEAGEGISCRKWKKRISCNLTKWVYQYEIIKQGDGPKPSATIPSLAITRYYYKG